MSEITPDTITFSGSVAYGSAEEVLDVLSDLKEIDSFDRFNNQAVDLEAEEPVIAFSNQVSDEYQNALTIQSVPSPEQLPEEPTGMEEDWDSEEFELDTLAVGVTFVYEQIDVLISILEDILDVIESINIQQFYFGLSLEEGFDNLSTISSLNAETEFDLSGVQFEHQNYLYSFQESDEGTEVYAVFGDDEKIDKESVEDFIQQCLEDVAPVIEKICHEE